MLNSNPYPTGAQRPVGPRRQVQGLLLCILFVCLAAQACSYYYYTVEERLELTKRVDSSLGPLHYGVGQIHLEQAKGQIREAMLADTQSLFLSFSLGLDDTADWKRSLRMETSEVKVDFTDPQQDYQFTPIE